MSTTSCGIGMRADAVEMVASRLGEVVAEPDIWPHLLGDLAIAAGAFGAMILQAGAPSDDVPWSHSLQEFRTAYYKGGWNHRDVRAIRSTAAVKRGLTVLTDHDLVSKEEIRRSSYYQDFLFLQKTCWFAAVAFRSNSTSVWGLVFQRTSRQGLFTREEQNTLAGLAPRLTDTATLSTLVGRTALTGTTNMLDLVGKATIAVSARGTVLGANAAATALFDDDFRIRGGSSLVIRDAAARAAFQALCGQMRCVERSTPSSTHLVLRRSKKMPLILKAVPLDGPAGSFFLGARFLLVVSHTGVSLAVPNGLLKAAFGLTDSEELLVHHLASGLSMAEAADRTGIARETARSQLKAVFAKTGTSRQAELVLMMSRLDMR